MIRPLRIAMLTHSTNPRGGVVHAMHLSEALTAMGHHVVLHAPDSSGRGFSRRPACETAPFRVGPTPTPMTELVEQRISDYLAYFAPGERRQFDLYHAHDGISGNALATLKAKGLIPGFVRTVHHIDQFSDPRLMTLQKRSIDQADRFFTVSALWQDVLKAEGKPSVNVGNGVDTARFSPQSDETDAPLRKKLDLPPGPIFLCVGGIEARKNTLRILDAFAQVRAVLPNAQLVIAGGVSLLDHGAYQTAFRTRLEQLPTVRNAVHIIGAVADRDLPALFRLADALVFPSVKEGFGLVVLEAMASGTPVVVSSIAPFTGYLSADDAIWCDPLNPASIAEAMMLSLAPDIRRQLIPAGMEVAARHSWRRTAEAHLNTYIEMMEPAHA
ncbi:MSMEG_0565 family glycosyltransferase [Rhizobium sp. RU36D]|uniref:MSMEG_0565 family glycosyltransferase n=1 Tax=Rhizobium sp. RU36D TaxID=1907415 RepID=UPI0009D7C24D|nr:MSMEG_0565 family glycosyltransferase [Rhizobium sp. RU36D]SMC71087.1 glycosyltransferase, MSMEG_0565 family [Rhizobium sp. RU36D]